MLANTYGETGWQIAWFNTAEANDDGTLFTLPIEVDAHAKSGTYPIKLTYAANDTINASGTEVPLATVDGAITVKGKTLSALLGGGNETNEEDTAPLPNETEKEQTPGMAQGTPADVPDIPLAAEEPDADELPGQSSEEQTSLSGVLPVGAVFLVGITAFILHKRKRH